MIHTASSLTDDASFYSARHVDADVPSSPGVYAIRLQVGSTLPKPFETHLRSRTTRLIYIGKATSLKTRMLGNELRGRGHGTFFRSLGGVLGYLPPAGSLVAMANKKNYSFGKLDRDATVEWINDNLEVNWRVMPLVDVRAAEAALITNHTPLLNLTGNPLALVELKELRTRSLQIASASTPEVPSNRAPNTDVGVTPEDLARELGHPGRHIRGFLRDSYPHMKYQRWALTPEQATEVRRHFGQRAN